MTEGQSSANWCSEQLHHEELTGNLSLSLKNIHPVLQYRKAFLPNMSSVAGIHIKLTEIELQLQNVSTGPSSK